MENNTYLKVLLSFLNGIAVANSMFKNFVIYTTLGTIAFVLIGFYGMNQYPEIGKSMGHLDLVVFSAKYSVPFGFVCSILACLSDTVRGLSNSK